MQNEILVREWYALCSIVSISIEFKLHSGFQIYILPYKYFLKSAVYKQLEKDTKVTSAYT